MERRVELFEAPKIVEIKLTEPLPETCYIGADYTLKGTVKLLGIGAPPWVYVEVKRKEWYKPEAIEEVSYERGLPEPISGKFSVDLKFDKTGSYEVAVVATPAPLSLPVINVSPVVGRSDTMKFEVEEPPPPAFRFSAITIDGQMISLVDHDADSGLLMRKTTADYLEIVPAFEWTGVRKKATISVKAGYKDLLGTFAPKTGAITKAFTLPESPFVPYEGELEEPIKVPLTACGDISDGAIEIVAKLPDMPDYITRIWNVYVTKIEKKFRFAGVTIDGQLVPLTDHDADSGLLLRKTTADSLEINPLFEWQGPQQTASISVKAGYKDLAGAFSPKTGAYTRSITLPESPEVPYESELETPISIPLVACGGLTDGAIEMVLKIAGFPDYISRIWKVYATKAPPEELGFDLARPYVSKTPVDPGTTIDITCPITSRCVKPVDARAKVIIYEGSLMPGHGAKIKEYDSGTFHIEPNESRNVVVHHTTVKGTIDRRDVEVEVYIDTQLVKESEWDDVFYVGVPPEEVIDFNLTRPTVTPAEITPGTAITITCPVTSACTKEQTATAKVLIYEGSIYAGHGNLIATKTSPAFSIAPGQTYNVNVQHTAIAGTIDRRDIEVEIYVGGKLVKESEWDDVYYVKAPAAVPPKADIQNPAFVATKGTYDIGDRVPFTCSYEYKGKAQRGQLVLSLGTGVYPTFSTVVNYAAMSIDFGEAMDWTRRSFSGTFLLTEALKPGQTYNTRAKLETLEDPTQETDTDWGVLAITEEAPKEYTLTASVSPSGTGTVTGAGKYTEGTYATCYANPASGYEFDRWGGDATAITQSVRILMDRNKTVIAYFKKKTVPGYTVTIWVRPLAAGWVTREPDKDSYAYGETVKLTAKSAPGYKFSYWTVDGERANYSTTLTLMVTKDLEVYARYTEV